MGLPSLLEKHLEAPAAQRSAPWKNASVNAPAAVRHLRSFALLLSGSRRRADDLVRATTKKAYQQRCWTLSGSNLHAALVTILRNLFYRDQEKDIARASSCSDESGAGGTTGFIHALQILPDEEREALILIEGSDFSWVEAAEICRTRIATVKHRVSCAKRHFNDIYGAAIVGPRPYHDR